MRVVLVVDDNAQDRKLLRLNLEHRGLRVREAADGGEALRFARAERPDLIVSDALMPRMDGFQLLRLVKADPKLRDVPFVFYSSIYTGRDEEALAVSLGALAFLPKPLDPEAFWQALQRVLAAWTEGAPLPEVAERRPEELEFLERYSDIVAAKLEEKVRELSAAKTAVEDRERRLATLFRNLRDVLVMADPDRRILDANQPALRDTFGYELDEVVGQKIAVLYADPQGFEATGRAVFERRDPSAQALMEVDFRRKNGEVFPGELAASKLLDEGGAVIGNLGLIRDVSGRRSLEEQLRQAQKMEAVGRLAGGVAHDFNNLLQVIIGTCELALADLAERGAHRKAFGIISEAADRAAGLTRQLLAFARKQVLEPKVLDLNQVVAGLGKMLPRLLGEDVRVVHRLAADLGRVRADPGQVEQVLVNLAVNARDAMPRGGTLTIETANVDLDEAYTREHPGASPGPHVLVAVTDTGTGIAPEVREHLFEPFFTTKEVGKGTGLGLATVYGIVKQSGGCIYVYSEPGQGAIFKVFLPRVDGAVDPWRGDRRDEPAPGGGETVLVAEDEAAVRGLLCQVLAAKGYAVLEAANGAEALGVAEGHPGPIHLVVADVVMPDLGGRELAERLRLARPGLRVLYVSGYTDDAILRRGALEPGAAFLQKPFAPGALARKVRAVLDGG